MGAEFLLWLCDHHRPLRRNDIASAGRRAKRRVAALATPAQTTGQASQAESPAKQRRGSSRRAAGPGSLLPAVAAGSRGCWPFAAAVAGPPFNKPAVGPAGQRRRLAVRWGRWPRRLCSGNPPFGRRAGSASLRSAPVSAGPALGLLPGFAPFWARRGRPSASSTRPAFFSSELPASKRKQDQRKSVPAGPSSGQSRDPERPSQGLPRTFNGVKPSHTAGNQLKQRQRQRQQVYPITKVTPSQRQRCHALCQRSVKAEKLP